MVQPNPDRARAYRGWEWTVTVARVPRGRTATVCEADVFNRLYELIGDNFRVLWARSSNEAFKRIQKQMPHLILMSMDLQEQSGVNGVAKPVLQVNMSLPIGIEYENWIRQVLLNCDNNEDG